MEHAFTWYSLAPYPLSQLPEHTVTAWLVMILLLCLALRFKSALATAQDPVVPDEKFSVRNVLEVLMDVVIGLSDSIIGHHGRKYGSLFVSFFLFILFSNFLGLIPGFVPPTSVFWTNLGLGLVSFFAYHYFGVRANGPGYFKQFLGPMLLLSWLFVLIEVFSHLFRPISLAIRLYGNMSGDHLVLEIFTNLTKVGIPVVFYILGSLVSVVQAAVFTILSIIYVAMAISHEH